MDLVKLVEFLHNYSTQHPIAIITLHQNQLIAAVNGRVSTTKIKNVAEPPQWRTVAAAISSCYQTWYPGKPFEALTHTIFNLQPPDPS